MVKAILIDSNRAIERVASQALAKLELGLIVVSKPTALADLISEVSPALILLSFDTCPIDPVKCCSDLCNHELREKFALIGLAGEKTSEQLTSGELGLKIDAVVSKPFTSGQLRGVCRAVLRKFTKEPELSLNAILVCKDSVLALVLTRLFFCYGIKLRTYESHLEAVVHCKRTPVDVLVLAWQRPMTTEWFNRDRMGRLVLINPEGETGSWPEVEGVSDVLSRPLYCKDVVRVLEKLFPDQMRNNASIEISLEAGEQALLAARISAAVYETLLHQAELRGGNWIDAAQCTYDEVLKICYDFEHLLGGIQK